MNEESTGSNESMRTATVPQQIRHEQSKDESIKGNSAPVLRGGDATIHDRAGLYIGIVALVVASISLGGVFMYLGMSDKLIEARIEAGIAKANATADAADTNARVALDKVEDFRAKLAEKGINVTLDGH